MKTFDKDVWHDQSTTQFEKWSKPNAHLITGDEVGAIELPANQLGHIVENFGSGQLKTRYLFGSVEAQKFTYVHRSMVFRFPDVVTVEIQPLSDTSSTLSIFSRSVYGYSDFGTNRRRAKDWLAGLRVAIERG